MDNILSQSVVLNKTVKMISYYSPITVFLIFSVVLFIVLFNRKRARMVKLIEKIPGPAALPILGNSIEMNVDHDGEYFRFFFTLSSSFHGPWTIYSYLDCLLTILLYFLKNNFCCCFWDFLIEVLFFAFYVFMKMEIIYFWLKFDW